MFILLRSNQIVRKSQSVYYFSFMKLIVSTFLVYKVKKCLLKSGKNTPPEVPAMLFKRSLEDHVMGNW